MNQISVIKESSDDLIGPPAQRSETVEQIQQILKATRTMATSDVSTTQIEQGNGDEFS